MHLSDFNYQQSDMRYFKFLIIKLVKADTKKKKFGCFKIVPFKHF